MLDNPSSAIHIRHTTQIRASDSSLSVCMYSMINWKTEAVLSTCIR